MGELKGTSVEITCLHTAALHVPRLSALFEAEGWEGRVAHIVRPDLLARAQAGGPEAVRGEVSQIIGAHMAGDALLCSCSTLGPLIESLAAEYVRVDRPVMEAAARYKRVMLVICLESTRAATVNLFEACAKAPDVRAHVIMCQTAWSLFEEADMAGFYAAIAQDVVAGMDVLADTDCIVLAQASMDGAAALLSELRVPVMTTPVLAVRRAIDVARHQHIQPAAPSS
ncbi:hypothetical protein [Sulfitobacter sp.]|jgi:hypothetical protein|uniref:hypothetical protein n=1 Tax=Sulfitobacter sp. TaxID=1903071 RepID=UPI000C421D5D|nr:hypothetical protein [Roseobacter sp.]MBV48053.1 hypothetical protein [Roseobacter sp.]|tara:strand:- start:17880 stop:18560 length:681 start_codon:yes stop_codon:yes gene_type:complete